MVHGRASGTSKRRRHARTYFSAPASSVTLLPPTAGLLEIEIIRRGNTIILIIYIICAYKDFIFKENKLFLFEDESSQFFKESVSSRVRVEGSTNSLSLTLSPSDRVGL